MHKHTILWVNPWQPCYWQGSPCTRYGVSPAQARDTPLATLGTSVAQQQNEGRQRGKKPKPSNKKARSVPRPSSWCQPEAVVQAELRQRTAGIAPGDDGETLETCSTTRYSVS